LVPRLKKYGYEPRYTTSILCCSSYLGFLIPPSIPGLIYCMMTQQSVAAVFLSTLFPGLILAFGNCVLNYFICPQYIKPELITEKIADTNEGFFARVKEISVSGWYALPAFGCPLLILVGIYGGLCTPNEAGSLAVIYCVVAGFFVYRELTVKKFWNATLSTLVSLGVVLILFAGGTVFARYLIRVGAAQGVADFMLGMFSAKVLILLAVNLFFLFIGMFIEAAPLLILCVPLVLPLMREIGVNLVHLGAIIIVNVGIGVTTPPFAISIFVGSRLSGCSYGELLPIMMRYLFWVGIPVLLLTTYFPVLSCWLPAKVLGARIVGPW
jgi:tripartite ATP-independent transporter DctM subunit